MRATYRVLAMLIALGVVLQAAFIAWGLFAVHKGADNGETFSNTSPDAGIAAHMVLGSSVIPLIALIFLIVSFFARIPGGVKWAAITFGVTVLQVGLAYVSYAVPFIGVLHGLNAFALAAVASIAMRKARLANTPGAPADTPVTA
jgi:hypothetical protein